MVCGFTENMSRCHGLQRAVADSRYQVGTGCTQGGMGGKVVDEGIRIEKDRLPAHQVGEGHTSSSLSARRCSKVPASPFQPIIPAVCSAKACRLWIVTRTDSFSLSGNGWSGLS